MCEMDIVDRLYDMYREWHLKAFEDAALEIERLRAELQSYYDEDEEIRRGRSGG